MLAREPSNSLLHCTITLTLLTKNIHKPYSGQGSTHAAIFFAKEAAGYTTVDENEEVRFQYDT